MAVALKMNFVNAVMLYLCMNLIVGGIIFIAINNPTNTLGTDAEQDIWRGTGRLDTMVGEARGDPEADLQNIESERLYEGSYDRFEENMNVWKIFTGVLGFLWVVIGGYTQVTAMIISHVNSVIHWMGTLIILLIYLPIVYTIYKTMIGSRAKG